jgi:peptidylprolyl isomerase
MKALIAAVLACGTLVLAGCGGASSASEASDASKGGPPAKPPGPLRSESAKQAARRPEPKVTPPRIRPPRELIVEDLIKGSGRPVEKGDDLAVHFTSIRFDGEFFESIWDKPFEFELSAKDVSPGWVQGLPGMRVGGRRELIVPTEMTSRLPIPPGQNYPDHALIYVVDLLRSH